MPGRTEILAVDPEHPQPEAIDRAVEHLAAGGLVAFPTETVYGLGADATNPEAVASLFRAKGRPAANPLIVHVLDQDQARLCVSDWSDRASRLAERYWPGPLTIVLPKSPLIPDIVTAGLDTVGVRSPSAPAARALLARLGKPLAAPSANRSNRLSPTLAQHVESDLAGLIDCILDAGPTALGLESTVLDLSGPEPTLLRPGPISREELAGALGKPIREREPAAGGPLTSPGQLPVHYAPNTPAVRIDAADAATFHAQGKIGLVVLGEAPALSQLEPVVRADLPDPETAMRMIYRVLHELDEEGLDLIVIVIPPDEPAWAGIRDRVSRASRRV